MKKTLLIVIFLFIGITENYSQGWQWKSSTIDSKILKDANDNLYIFSNSSTGFTIEKLDKNGITLWTKTANGNAKITAYKVDSSNNLVILGNLEFSTTIDTFTIIPKGQQSFFILKLSPNSTVLSVSVYGSPTLTFANDLFINANGEYLIGGGYTGAFDINGYIITGDTLQNFFIVKTDANLNVLWSEKSTMSAELAWTDEVVETASGKIYATITFKFGLIEYKGYQFTSSGQHLIQLDNSRNITWAYCLGYPGLTFNLPNDIQTNGDTVYLKEYYEGPHHTYCTINMWTNLGVKTSTNHTYAGKLGYAVSNEKIYFAVIAANASYIDPFIYRKIGSLTLDLSQQGQPLDSIITQYGSYSEVQFINDSTLYISGNGEGINTHFVGKFIIRTAAPFASNKTICSGSTASLSATGTGTLGWYTAAIGGTYLGGGAIFITPPLTSNTTYYVQDSTYLGSSSRTAILVYINASPPTQPTASNVTICNGNTASLSASGIGTLGWYTAATDGTYLGEGTNFITPVLTATTTYYVQDSTCAASSIRTPVIVTVNPLPLITGNTKATMVCWGSSIILTGEGASSYIWSGGVIDGISFVPSSSTTYTVSGTDLNNCSNTATITLTVSPLADVSTNLNGTIISANQTGAVYQWLDCNNGNSPIVGATDQSYNATINGNYAVIVSLNGCSDTSTCVNVNITGISEIPNNNNQLCIFPNPGNGVITVTLSGVEGQSTSDGVYTIMNESGQSIQLFELNSGNKFSINIEDLSNGIYFIVGYNNNNQMMRQKVVVAK